MSTQNFNYKEARDHMAEMVDSIKTGMLITDIGNKPLSAIPMSTNKVDDEGNIWFLSRLDSDHNSDIVRDGDVQLLYSNPSGMEFISIYGKAAINTKEERLKELYSKSDDAWFDGLDDPNLTAIKIVPHEAYFWDTKQNKYIGLFKMGLAAVTGEKQDVGDKGKLNL